MEGSGGDLDIEQPNAAGDGTLVNGTDHHNGTNGDSLPLSNHTAAVNNVDHSSSKEKHSSSSKHSSSGDKHSSDKHRDDKHRSDKHHSSSSSKDKHKSSSSSGDKHKHSSSSSSHKSKDGSSHKEGSSSSHKHSSSSSKHSSSKDGHHRSKDGHSSSSSKDKHHSSSSSSKDKDKHKSSSSSHKEHSSSSKHGSSSSSKHSSSENKHRSDKDKHREHKDKHRDGDKHKHREGEKPKNEDVPVKVKEEVPEVTPEVKQEVKEEPKPSPPKVKDEPESPMKVKVEPVAAAESDDDMPLSARKEAVKEEKPKKRPVEDSDDDEPLSARVEKKKVKPEKKEKAVKKEKNKKRKAEPEEDDYPVQKKKKKAPVKEEPTASPTKKMTKKEREAEEEAKKWKWWEEERSDDGTKWKFLEHKGPVLAPEYEVLPDHVKFYYDGKVMKLTPETEEVATFYGRMIDHDYCTMDVFNKNFMKDWRKVMSAEEREKIKDLKLCNFKEIDAHFKHQSELRKNRTKEEKEAQKKENAALVEEYGFCKMDGHTEKIGNFRIEPPGLFRGRGTHPKMGMLKTRTLPEHVIINCSKDAKVPDPPAGHRWKEVRHDNKVSWLACWQENVQGQTKYVMLNAASRLKGEKDWQKYETARKLHRTVDKIRAQYREDWKSKEMRVRQRSVAMYFIDKLALRAGNEKDEGESADTVGCCSLRVEHIRLHEKLDDKENVVEFDFLGKDSIRYYNKVAIEKRVFKNLQLFTDNKNDGDDLFDRLNTAILNKHLQSLMDGLTAKVFRTYNASKTLQEQLNLLTNPIADDPVPAKLLSYNRANRAVAVLCNHQRAVPKNFTKQMEGLQNKIDDKNDAIKKAKKEMKQAKQEAKNGSDKMRQVYARKKKAVERLEEQLTKLEVQLTDKDENKEIALGTSKLNYLDPRISVAWCKKWEVPIEKIYNKTQRDKFAWAIDMTEEDFEF